MAAARVNTFELGFHAARLGGALVLLALAAHHPALALGAAALVYVAAFAFNHDVAHGALGLPRPLNEALLSVLSLVMGNSGHGMRLLHLRHHARPLAADDVEGHGATVPVWRALWLGPKLAARYRLDPLAVANRRERRLQLVENAVALLLTLAALASRSVAGAAWAVANVALMLTLPAWASHLPHRAPRWLRRAARHLAWTKSAAVLSFAFHDEHHLRPKVPCGELKSEVRVLDGEALLT